MDDEGNFYIGNKKTVLLQVRLTHSIFQFQHKLVVLLNSSVQKKVDLTSLTHFKSNIRRGISVEGGTDGDALSKFDGPVIFNNKLTSTSPKGIEATNVLIQGDATISRKFTVGLGTPTESGNSGDVVFRAILVMVNMLVGFIQTRIIGRSSEQLHQRKRWICIQ